MELVDLLKAVQSAVQALSVFSARAVYLTPHANYMPTGTPYPCCAITDGGIKKRIERPGELIDEIIRIPLTVCVPMGTDAIDGTEGVLALCEAIDQELDTNTLDLDCVQWAMSSGETGCQLFVTQEKRWVVKKTIYYEYEIERPRPKERTS